MFVFVCVCVCVCVCTARQIYIRNYDCITINNINFLSVTDLETEKFHGVCVCVCVYASAKNFHDYTKCCVITKQ